MNEKLKNLNKKQFEKCLITLEMLTFETPKIYTVDNATDHCFLYTTMITSHLDKI